jgi:2'-5' RNA ligase
MRMFVAVVPPPEVIEDLADFVEPRREVDSPLRWTVTETWHLTLAFMESVADRQLDELTERLTRAAHRREPFELQIAGSGTFPNPARAKILWAGIQGDTVQLRHLAVGSRAAASKAGIEVDGAKYRPHLSLARIPRPIDVTRWLRVFDSYVGPSWRVTEIELIESHLGEGPRGRPRHEPLATFALGG